VAALGNTGTKPATGNILQIRLISIQEQQLGMVILHYRAGTLITGGATNGEIVTALSTAFETVLKPCMNPATTFLGVDLKDLTAILDAPCRTRDDTGLGSGTASDPLPMQTCGIITKYTLAGGPGFRGRAYIPFPGEADNDAANDPGVAYFGKLGALATVMQAVQTVVGAGGTTPLQPVIYHRGSGGADDITNCIARSYWATQRRRGQRAAQNRNPLI